MTVNGEMNQVCAVGGRLTTNLDSSFVIPKISVPRQLIESVLNLLFGKRYITERNRCANRLCFPLRTDDRVLCFNPPVGFIPDGSGEDDNIALVRLQSIKM